MSNKVADIVIDSILRDVDKKGSMPWQRPYEMYNAFNYFTLSPYKGINRMVIPFGEYMTMRQVVEYNVNKGYVELDSAGKPCYISEDAFLVKKDATWYPVVYFKKDEKIMDIDTVKKLFGDVDTSKNGYIGRDATWSYTIVDGVCYKIRNILRYYRVSDRTNFVNARGEVLPSRIDMGDVEITKQIPKKVLFDYLNREKIHCITDYMGVPYYSVDKDCIYLNPLSKDEDLWFSTAFHEAAHSTGSAGRLDRFVGNYLSLRDSRAKEECLVEICACLCCAETGIDVFNTSCTSVYDNSLAYIQFWKKKIKSWGTDFIYLVSQADKAFNYICNNPDGGVSIDIK